MITFDKFKNKYFIEIVITNISPFHIGSGNDSVSPLEPDNSVMKNSRGEVIIPGSSLKGMFRANTEMIIKTFNQNKVCDETGNSPCIDPKERKEKTEEEWEKYIEENICEVCDLYGSNSFASRIYFSDAFSTNAKISVKDGIKIRRDTEVTFDKGKFDYEIVEPGAEFKTDILLENAEDYHIGYVIMIIEMVNSGIVKIGGKKSAGLGNLKIEYKIKKLTFEDIENGIFSPEYVDENFTEIIKKETKNHLKALKVGDN